MTVFCSYCLTDGISCYIFIILLQSLIAVDPGCGVHSGSVVIDLIVDVIGHSGAIAAAMKSPVSRHCLTRADRRWHVDAIGFTVEDHDTVTCNNRAANAEKEIQSILLSNRQR